MCIHYNHHHPLVAEQVIISFLHAHRSLASVATSSTDISTPWHPNTHRMHTMQEVRGRSGLPRHEVVHKKHIPRRAIFWKTKDASKETKLAPPTQHTRGPVPVMEQKSMPDIQPCRPIPSTIPQMEAAKALTLHSMPRDYNRPNQSFWNLFPTLNPPF